MAVRHTFLIIYGDEDFQLDRFIRRRKDQWKGRDIELRDGASITEESLVSLCRARSIFDESSRAIILDNAQELEPEKALLEYLDKRDPKDTSTVLLAVVRSRELPAAWKAFAKKGWSDKYQKYKPWETDLVIGRISEEAAELGLKLDKGVPEIIHFCLGDNLRATVNELGKLAYLVKPGTLVTQQLVTSVIAKDQPAEPYQVAEQAIAKRAKQAMNLSSLVYQYMGDGASVPITSALMRQVEKMLVVRQMLDKGDAHSVIAASLGMHEFACKKNVIPVAQKHTVPTLVGHMKSLCRLDGQVKGPARSKRTLVELAILSIATGA